MRMHATHARAETTARRVRHPRPRSRRPCVFFALAACNKGPWTEEEDRLILERVQQHGTKWAKISGLYLPDRPENDIKNRWHILIRMRHDRMQGPNGAGPSGLATLLTADASSSDVL
jgi:hypothetical protein